MSDLIKDAENWLKQMTDGGYCETSDCNEIIKGLLNRTKELDKEIDDFVVYSGARTEVIVELNLKNKEQQNQITKLEKVLDITENMLGEGLISDDLPQAVRDAMFLISEALAELERSE
jgi:hypothetical protein